MPSIVPLSSVEQAEASRRILEVNKSIIGSLLFSIVDQLCDGSVVILLAVHKEWQLLMIQVAILLYAARMTAYRTYVQPLKTVRQNEEKEYAEKAELEEAKRLELRRRRKKERQEKREGVAENVMQDRGAALPEAELIGSIASEDVSTLHIDREPNSGIATLEVDGAVEPPEAGELDELRSLTIASDTLPTPGSIDSQSDSASMQFLRIAADEAEARAVGDSRSVDPSLMSDVDSEVDSDVAQESLSTASPDETEERVARESNRQWATSKMKPTHLMFVILSLFEVQKFKIGCRLVARRRDRSSVDLWVVFANSVYCRAIFCTAPQLFIQLYAIFQLTHDDKLSLGEIAVLSFSVGAYLFGFAFGLFAYESIQAQTEGLAQFPTIFSKFYAAFFLSRGMELFHRAFTCVAFLYLFPVFWFSCMIAAMEELLLIRFMYKSFVNITSGWMHSMKPQDPALPRYTPSWKEALKILHRATVAMYPMYTIVHAQRYFEACLPIGPAFPLRSYNLLRLGANVLKSLLLVTVHCLDCRTSCAGADANPFCGGLRGFRFGVDHKVVAEKGCADLTGTYLHPGTEQERNMKLCLVLGAIWISFICWKVAYMVVHLQVNTWHNRYLANDDRINMSRAWLE